MSEPRLSVGMYGDAVRSLHEKLRRHGFEIPLSEAERGFFGPATRAAVLDCQREHGIGPTGEVDERTRDAIDETVAARPSGRHAGMASAAWAAPASTPRAAGDISALLGTRESARARAGTPAAALSAVRGAAAGDTTGAALRSDVSRDAPAASAVVDAGKRLVEGRIYLHNGSPAVGLTVRVYSRELGGAERRLGEIRTDEGGLYSLPYEAGGKAVHLEVRFVDRAGKEVPLSKTRFNAQEHEVLNLVAPVTAKSQTTEYERLTGDLGRQLGGLTGLATARESNGRQDLTMLHHATGWDARLLALAVSAARLSADTNGTLSQEGLYGLLRTGLPSGKLLLAHVSSDAVEQALSAARDAGIVSLTDREIGEFKQRFDTFAMTTRLATRAPGSGATYGDLLKASGLGGNAQATFASVFAKHTGPASTLWSEAQKAGLNGVQIATLKLQGKLAFLTGNNPGLTRRLQESLTTGDPVELVGKDLHTATRWVEEIHAATGIPRERRDNLTEADRKKLDEAIPPRYAAETVEARRDLWARDMARKLKLSYPTHVIGRMVVTDTNGLGLGAAREPTAKLLQKAATAGFRLGQTPVSSFLQTYPGVKSGLTTSEVKAAEAGLKTLHRVYQITSSDEAMVVLLQDGVTSAYEVVEFAQEEFEVRYAERFPSPHEARLTYIKAKQVSAITYNLFAIASQFESQTPAFAFSASSEVVENAKNELIKQFPTMESLFGSMDFCECEHCRSVLSPAAYLVDLLQFTDPEPSVWSNFLERWEERHGHAPYPHRNVANVALRPYDVLESRRPDIAHIPLTCENTLTALPYIDVVNEILEFYVANNTLTKDAARDTGDTTTAALLAEPQNIIEKAYDHVRDARYPLTLPFDLWLETVRQFCQYYETPLARIMEALRPTDALFAPAKVVDREGIFLESLGLSSAEVEIFTNADPLAKWFELYGFDDDDPAITVATDSETKQRIDLNSAKALARRLGVKYKELVEIIRTGFVNPKLDELALLYKMGVSIHSVLLRRDPQNTTLYQQNKDLLDKARSDLSETDKARFDTLTPAQWTTLKELQSFEARLQEFTSRFKVTAAQVEAQLQAIPFDDVLLLADPDAGCDFDLTTLRYASGDAADGIAFLKINLFTRLWRKLGWTTEEVDRALRAFVPKNATFESANLSKQPLRTALIYLAHLKSLDEKIRAGKQNRLRLLTLWSNIPVTGKKSLYAQLFLTRNVPKETDVFDHPWGDYLSAARIAAVAQAQTYSAQRPDVAASDKLDPAAFASHPKVTVSYDAVQKIQHLSFTGVLTNAEKATLSALSTSSALAPLLDAIQQKAAEFSLLKGHLAVLQGALGLTAGDIDLVLADANLSLETAELSLPHVSLLYRYGLLAKALKLSMRELIALKHFSGLNPFKPLSPDPLATLDDDYPFTHTLRFVEVAEHIRESGFKIEDVEYLLRDRFDESGKYRRDRAGPLQLLKSIADGIRAIRAEHAALQDPAAVTEEYLRSKLGLVLAPEVVERLLAMMNGTVEVTVVKTGVATSDRLDAAGFAGEMRFREVSYNTTRQEQRLTFRGVLFDPEKTALLGRLPKPVAPAAHVPSAVLAELLGAVQADARAFFQSQLQKQTGEPASGLLAAADFDLLFDPTLATGETEQERVRKQRATLTTAFLPYLQQRLIRELIVTTLTAQTAGARPLVESLVTDAGMLAQKHGAASRSLLEGFADTATPALSATFFFSTDQSGVALWTRVSVDAIGEQGTISNALRPMGADRAELRGEIKVPQTGNYVWSVLVPKKATRVELRIEGQAAPIVNTTSTQDAEELSAAGLALDPGKRYGIVLVVNGPGAGDAKLQIMSSAVPKDTLNSGRVEGYLEVPVSGDYRFFVGLDKQDAKARLRFPELGRDLPERVALTDRDELAGGADDYVQLMAGIPHRFTLDLFNLKAGQARLHVLGEALPKTSLAALTLYADDASDAGARALVLLGKVLQLVATIGLSERELRYLLTHAADFAGLDLSALPTAPSEDTEAGAALLFKQLLRVLKYARLKRDLAAATDDLIAIFEANGKADLNTAYELIAKLTRRDKATVTSAATALLGVPSFGSEEPLSRLWEVLQIVERFGVPAPTLFDWLTIVRAAPRERRAALAGSVRDAIKARYEPETWQRVAQPIFDRLRQRKRDALVALVMDKRRFDRIEQLYEFFLIDPGMEPVVQTSRIRLAIASVQLFVQRCLLNLEKNVHPTAIVNARHWEWMKRYRVWEANRKIFLFPENWLEPEFRDDKTHLFTELESALLESDVSSDVVEDAFLTYLKKLEELARLEIVAMHLEDAGDPARNTLHVIGRTHAQPNKYFYRRYAHQMWTAWEPVTAEVEGDHLAPVVWRNRLYLFWVTFLVKGKENTGSQTLGVNNDQITIPALTKEVEAHLHWSEYVNGEWSTRESGNFTPPESDKVKADVSSSFHPNDVSIHVSVQYDESGEERGVFVHLGSPISRSFYLAGRNSAPERRDYSVNPPLGNRPANPFTAKTTVATGYTGSDAFTVEFEEWSEIEEGVKTDLRSGPMTILRRALGAGPPYRILPCNNNTTIGDVEPGSLEATNPDAVAKAINSGLGEIVSLMKPVFYDDEAHTFFVEPNVTERTVEQWEEWVTRTRVGGSEWRDPDWWKEIVLIPEQPIWPPPVEIPGIAEESLFEAKIKKDWLINPGTVMIFDGQVIGPRGRDGLEIRHGGEPRERLNDGAVSVAIHPASDPGVRDTTIVARNLDRVGLRTPAGGLTVIGATGFTSAMAENLEEMESFVAGADVAGTNR